MNIRSNQVVRAPVVDRSLLFLTQKVQDGAAAETRIHAANAKLEKFFFLAGTHRPKEANLLTVPPNRQLQLTVVMSVSGHTGDQGAKFAKDPNQTWTIEIERPDGAQTRTEVRKETSTQPAYAIAADVTFDISMPGKYRVSAWPTGSYQVAGSPEFRQYNLNVGAANFYRPGPDEAASMKLNGAMMQARARGEKYTGPIPQRPIHEF